MADSFNWSGLLGAAQKSHNDPLYAALLGAQGAGNSQAAMGFLNSNKLNPMMGDFGQGNRPGFQSSNPNYVNPKGWGATVAGGGTGGTGGAGGTDEKSQTQQLHDFWSGSDYWHDLIPTFDPADTVKGAGDALQQALKASLARQTITQTGYDAGMKNYDTDLNNATNFANSYIPGQLNTGRLALDDILSAAGKSAKDDPGSYNFQDTLDQLHNSATSTNTGLAASLKAQLASNGFFSTAPAFTAAGSAQGAYNPPASDDLLKALMAQTGRGGTGGAGTVTRQLGNTGAF